MKRAADVLPGAVRSGSSFAMANTVLRLSIWTQTVSSMPIRLASAFLRSFFAMLRMAVENRRNPPVLPVFLQLERIPFTYDHCMVAPLDFTNARSQVLGKAREDIFGLANFLLLVIVFLLAIYRPAFRRSR